MKHVRKTAFLAVLAFGGLAGCASVSVTDANGRMTNADDDQQCKSIGALQGTQSYGGCRLRLEAARQAAQSEKWTKQRMCGPMANGVMCN